MLTQFWMEHTRPGYISKNRDVDKKIILNKFRNRPMRDITNLV